MPPIAFDWREGQSLQFLDALLNRGRADALTEPVALDALRPELLRYGAKRIARSCVRWLVEGGGWRARQVLREGRRVSGRAWDAALDAGFALRFTDATRRLWLDGMAVIPGLVGRSGAREVADERGLRAGLAALAPPEETATGDWIFAAIASSALPGFRLAPRDEGVLQRALRAASPLVTLAAPAPDAPPAAFERAAARLVDGPAARVLECAEDRVARAWSREAAEAMRATAEADALALRWQALGAAMQSLCDAADRAGRADLCRPAAKAVAAMLTTTFAAGGESARRALSQARGLRSVRDRDALLAAVGRVAGVGVWLLRRRDSLGAERYGDARYEEAQVLLRDVDGILGPVRREVEGLARAMTSEIG